jgi:hypothetical protein
LQPSAIAKALNGNPPYQRRTKMTISKIALGALALLLTMANANAETLHYSCKSDDARYALTINTDRHIVKLLEHGYGRGPHQLTFKILKVAPSDVCAKYGWILNGATFCTATQGVGDLSWNGLEFDCDLAETE